MEKRLLILCDNAGLSRAIELNLEYTDLEIIEFALSSQTRWENLVGVDNLDLVMIASSSPDSLPLVVTALLLIAERISQVPVLLIADVPFDADSNGQISYLNFPFDIEELHAKVDEILHGGVDDGTGNDVDRTDELRWSAEPSIVPIGAPDLRAAH